MCACRTADKLTPVSKLIAATVAHRVLICQSCAEFCLLQLTASAQLRTLKPRQRPIWLLTESLRRCTAAGELVEVRALPKLAPLTSAESVTVVVESNAVTGSVRMPSLLTCTAVHNIGTP